MEELPTNDQKWLSYRLFKQVLRHRSRMINLNSLKAIYSKGSTVVATDFDDVDMSLLECTNENMAHNLVGIIAKHFAHYDVLTIGLEGSKIDVSPTPRQ